MRVTHVTQYILLRFALLCGRNMSIYAHGAPSLYACICIECIDASHVDVSNRRRHFVRYSLCHIILSFNIAMILTMPLTRTFSFTATSTMLHQYHHLSLAILRRQQFLCHANPSSNRPPYLSIDCPLSAGLLHLPPPTISLLSLYFHL